MKNIYSEIIRKENLFFRGLTLGANISEVEAIEGSNYHKKKGSHPSLYYYWDTGEVENIDLYFGLSTEEKVNRVKLMFYTYPDFYHEQQTGEDFTAFEKRFYENDIEASLKVPNELLNSILIMFTNDLGTPQEEHDDEVFNKKHQNFKRFIWFKDHNASPLRLSLTSYLDDSDGRNIKWVLSLLLSENITP